MPDSDEKKKPKAKAAKVKPEEAERRRRLPWRPHLRLLKFHPPRLMKPLPQLPRL